MDTDETPRMLGALSPRDDLKDSVNRQSAVENGDTRFLGVTSDSKALSRSPSVLNDVQMREDGDDDSDSGDDDESTAGGAPVTAAVSSDAASAAPLSKNQQKRLKRQLKWEGGREDRKRKRKERRHQKQVQRRAAKREKREAEGTAAPDTTTEVSGEVAPVKERVLVPISLIFDCAFESYMRDTELISLSGQITRSYSANRMATRQTRIFVSSWQGKLRERYETLLANQHKRWQHAYFVEEDFMGAGRQAEAAMRREGGGVVVDVLGDADKEAKEAKEEATSGLHSVVYLTSDSPHTLTRLEPYTSYVIGGIVDKNREKGLCYRRAQEHGVRTAKLPIGDYMVMASRKVLTTNHVVEIMLQWLETGDWATAFERVMPKRKGGRLREPGASKDGEGEGEGEDEDGEGEDNEDDEDENEAETGAEGNNSQDQVVVDAEVQTTTKAAAEA
ncbi:tRNA m g methyltransferase domain containing protein [Grosmannia clavigera kw1407]|uniref:tRNA (guanine(9)-N1)-methyltransferase n=1 Tax=Grosmannia clavigera (strain kw1407 / UAMH 11150) TaxID=655863 RepID=F0XN73_GROCL|nr:tRNA m g methyltransferase domain containing protein [Grosmannia clavigera kw1407]EFX00953.1 tRNA m g methyltransferase domain containing protein [Grosmannia clavigera kw1407]